MSVQVERLVALPYTRALIPNEDGTWFAYILEFTGCMTEGSTPEEAIVNLSEATAGWIEVHIEDGDLIPPPSTTNQYSGTFLMRVPKTLHRELALRADREGVSLNQFALSALSRALGLCE